MPIMIFIIFFLTAFSSSAWAAEINASDAGTYVLLGRNHQPTELFYRLTGSAGKWLMEGKEPGGKWQKISCDKGCEYRSTTRDEVMSYFPANWVANTDIACIQNIAQAFCRYTPKEGGKTAGYVVIALVTGRPMPLFIQRVKAP